MKIAITSVTGKLGKAVTQQLINDIGAENVIGIARTPSKAESLGLGIEIRQGDYNNRAEFDIALQGIDSVLLIPGMDAPQHRIQQHRNVIEAAKENGVKKFVYNSIIGAEEGTAFSPIVQSNRQTEADIQASGMQWVIGRSGIYIEPDLDYIENYIKEGSIKNCAGEGRCTYTNHAELAYAYSKLLTEDIHHQQIYNLVGEAITQQTLADNINQIYQTSLSYQFVPFEDYLIDRKAALGDFIGTVVAGIYQGMHDGANDVKSDFLKASSRPHKSVLEMIKEYAGK